MSFCECLTQSYVRDVWSAIPAVIFVLSILLFSLPIPVSPLISQTIARIRAPFLPTLKLSEAEEFERQFTRESPGVDESSQSTSSNSTVTEDTEIPPRWRTTLFLASTLIEAAVWLTLAISNVICVQQNPTLLCWRLVVPFFTATTWTYALARVLHKPFLTPPYDLLILGFLHLIHGVFIFGVQIYASIASGTPLHPGGIFLVTEVVNLGTIAVFLGLILSLPLNVPSSGIDRTKIGTTLSPEDYTSLAKWITFAWVQRLVDVGRNKTLGTEDVWELSPTLKARPTFSIYRQSPGTRVLLKLLRANSMDLIINFFFTIFCVFLDFAGPFFLRLILVGLENKEPRYRVRLYLYATLAFMANVLKAQAELQHLWYARRAASRIGTQINAALYDKALRIKDQSGVIPAKAPHDGSGNPERQNADVGKIVNLMGIDCQKLVKQVSAMSSIYAAPLELILSCIFLYDLLGISAFAGFISLAIALPLSQWLAKMTVYVTQSTLVAKDSRMKLVNEMFGSIKFIKLFAWENEWTKRVMQARDVEIKWLKKARNINVVYSLVWTLVPSMVSILSFLVYVSAGHELNASIAFPAIRLFEMLRNPLGALPYALITLAQTKVSLDRLDTFFGEDEVPDDVCSLTRSATPAQRQELTLDNATFTWPQSGRSLEHKMVKPGEIGNLSEPGTSNNYRASPELAFTIDRGLDRPFKLRNITLRLIPEGLTVITGPTASGKTSLLLALLGEMDRLSGSVSIPKNPTVVDKYGLTNSIAYASQTPWLQHLSIKDNIVFGYPFDRKRYDDVIEACTLRPDLNALEDGDLTEIGSKGVTLSGGQKARVALARAVYAPTQYLLLDDIFSAVDSHTARLLVERLLQGPLVAHRIVLLVTHHIDLVLPIARYVVQMFDGRVHYQGKIEGFHQKSIVDYIAHDPYIPPSEALLDDLDKRTVRQKTYTTMKPQHQPKKLVEDEVRAEGSVKWTIYKTYLQASSYWTWVCVLLGIIAAETSDVATRLWISIWDMAYRQPSAPRGIPTLVFLQTKGSDISEGNPWYTAKFPPIHNLTTIRAIFTNIPDAHLNPFFYVGVYCAIGVAAAVVAMCTEWVLFTGGLRAGRALFQRLLTRLSSATFRFYDITPTGRVLNRFGKDFDTLDGTLPFMLHHTTTTMAAFFAAVLTVIVVVPWFLPIAAVLAYCYIRLSLGYLAASRDLRRMESISRSPILTGFSDLVDGIITVRAFSMEQAFLDRHYERVDVTNKFWYYTYMLNRSRNFAVLLYQGLLFRFDVLGSTSVYASTLLVLAGYISVGLAGLTIVSAMTFTTSVYWTCRRYTELELCLNSVERVVEFLDVPQEPMAIIDSCRVPAYWPSNSNLDPLVMIEGLEVKYAPELPSILHGVSFSLNARERVGLLGRTGCGKSTLAMSLLRFVEPHKGRIIIGGIDITTIGTYDLRSRITFITQDQALFLGTVRDNLDPFNEHTDEECLDALARVHLITEAVPTSQKNSSTSSGTSTGHVGIGTTAEPSSVGSEVVMQADDNDGITTIDLDTKVSAGGQNFSSGQRQLLTMARALLKQSGILILDEATSSIDKATDLKIQATIRNEFNNSLILTIAHRLETVIDFDRIIVLDKGRIVEFDTPNNLIRRDGGVFRGMCIQSGSFDLLEAAARDHSQKFK